jgi:hypothetical protein
MVVQLAALLKTLSWVPDPLSRAGLTPTIRGPTRPTPEVTIMERRQLDLPDLDAVLAEARRLHEAGYEAVGQWNLAQACRHCTMPINGCIDGIDFKPSWLLRTFIKLTGAKGKFFATRKIKPGLPAPPSTVFESGEDEAMAITELEQAIARLKQHDGPFAVHPFFGRLSADQWHQFNTIHTMHHLGFFLPASP